MKSAFPQLVPAPGANERARGDRSGFSRPWQTVLTVAKNAFVSQPMWAAGPQDVSTTTKVVSIERKPTIFYPIGWMAIVGVAAWFTWLALG